MKIRTSSNNRTAEVAAAAAARLPLTRTAAAAAALSSMFPRAAVPCVTTLFAICGGCQTTVTPVAPGGGMHAPTQRTATVTRAKSTTVAPERPVITTSSKGSLRTGDALDPCAERLHDVCGALLIYYIQHRQLPPTLQDLQDLQDGPEPIPPLVCPETHKPYVYIPTRPIVIDNPAGHIVLHDAVAGHDGTRWCVVVSSGASANEPMIAKAIGIKEDRFAVLRSRSLAADASGK